MRSSPFSESPEGETPLLSPETQLDALCERFEASWKKGKPLVLEEFIQSLPAGGRSEMLYELLAIEGHYRRHDASFGVEACVARFPQQAESVWRWFAEGRLKPGAVNGATPESVERGTEDRFRKLHFHARGGLGQVWIARDRQLGRDVAYKEIRSRLADDPQAQARFVREAEITGQLEHPGIPAVYALARDAGGRPFYAMRFVGGQTFEAAIEHWRRQGQGLKGLEFQQLLRRLIDVCHIVDYAHSQGVLHRDLKPQNIMLGQHGETVVLDWGLAVRFGAAEAPPEVELREDVPPAATGAVEPSHDDSTPAPDSETYPFPRHGASNEYGDAWITEPSAVLGTWGYMPPEQFEGRRDELLPASDVFALGAILYRILSRRPSRTTGTAAASAQQLARQPSNQLLPRDAPRGLRAICFKAMAREPGDRYRSARELADDLERWLADDPVAALPDRLPAAVARWLRRHRRTAAAGAVVAGVLIASLTMIVTLQNLAQVRIAERNRVIERQRDESYTMLEREQIARAARSLDRRSEAQAALRLVPPARRGWEWRRLMYELELGPRPISSLGTHDWGVLDFLWDEKSATLVTAGHDGRLLVRRGAQSEPLELMAGSWSEDRLAWRHALFPFPGEPDELRAEDCILRLCWLEPGAEFVGVSLRGKVVAWSLRADDQRPARQELALHPRALYCVAAQRNRILCGDDRGELLFIERQPAEAPTVKTNTSPTRAAALDVVALPDGRWAVARQDGRVSLLDERAAQVVGEIHTDGPAWDLDISPDGSLLATACGRGQVDCYRFSDSPGDLIRSDVYRPHAEIQSSVTAMQAVRFSSDGQWLAAGDGRGRLLLWNRKTAQPVLVGETYAVMSAENAADAPWPFRRRVAAIEFSASGDECLLAGHDPVIRRWQVGRKSGISELQLGPGPRTRFDPVQNSLLWVAGSDGTLAIWDTGAQQKMAGQRAHSGPVIAIDVVADSAAGGNTAGQTDRPTRSVAATCGPGGEIRSWSLQGEVLTAAKSVIRHHRELDDLAFSPNGRRLAACDVAHHVMIWELATGRLLATRALASASQKSTRGRVAFNVDGSQLAVLGPGPTLRLLEPAALELIEQPYTVAGTGGTALHWSPLDAETLFTGDTLGRVVRYPHGDWGRLNLLTPGAEVAGIAFSPLGDGGRIAVAWRNGKLSIIDPKWAGTLLNLESPHAGKAALAATELHFDAAGRRLALIHQDGAAEIWETPAEPALPVLRAARKWRRKSLVSGAKFAGLNIRHQAAACDDLNRLAILFTALDDGQDLTAPESDGRKLFFLRTSAQGVRIEEFEHRAVARSLALQASGDELLATVRRPLPEAGGTDGAFLMLRGGMTEPDSSVAWSIEDLTPRPNNEGFDVELLSIAGQQLPIVVHFSHSAWHLLATWHDGVQWQTARLGRQGDGFRHLTAASAECSKLFSLFSSNGLSGNKRTADCLVVDWPLSTRRRKPFEPAVRGRREDCKLPFGAAPRGIAIDREGFPAILYAQSSEGDRLGLQLARHGEGGWRSSEALPITPEWTSNLALDGGDLTFAYLAPDERGVYLASQHDNLWTSERVGDVPGHETETLAEYRRCELSLKIDDNGRPLIVAAVSDSEFGSIYAFQTVDR